MPSLNWNLPNLNEIVTRGAVSEGMIGVFPTVTAPSTASIVTGVSPSVHGIPTNFLFDPDHTMTTTDSGNEYAELIHVPTLWTLAHEAGLRTGQRVLADHNRSADRRGFPQPLSHEE